MGSWKDMVNRKEEGDRKVTGRDKYLKWVEISFPVKSFQISNCRGNYRKIFLKKPEKTFAWNVVEKKKTRIKIQLESFGK